MKSDGRQNEESKRFSEESSEDDVIVRGVSDSPVEGKTGVSSVKPFVVGAVIALVAALITSLFLIPAFRNYQAKEMLRSISQRSGEVRLVNSSSLQFTGKKIDGTTEDQLALGGDTATPSGGFVFSNQKDNAEKKYVTVFLDLSNKASRDFLMMNSTMLHHQISSGFIDLTVHLVPTKNAFSLYSSEALAEVGASSPSDSWKVLTQLAKTGSELTSGKSEDILSDVLKSVRSVGVNNVTEESLRKGSYTSWLLTAGDDSRLRVGFYPPVIYSNSRLIDNYKVNVNNSDDLRKELLR